MTLIPKYFNFASLCLNTEQHDLYNLYSASYVLSSWLTLQPKSNQQPRNKGI
jgi:hypothetical protein